MRRLIFRSFLSPGDVVMLTAAVRDLHLANPGQFQTDVRTSANALWENNPHLTRLGEGIPGVEMIDMHYPLVHSSNDRPYHFIHGFAQFLEERLKVRVPISQFRGDIHLSAAEKTSTPLNGHPLPQRFWIIVAGGKYDFTAKWWNPSSYQKVIDHFEGRIQFVQCGEAGHWHPPLQGVVNLVGKTDTRQFIHLMHHADGVVCPVTFAMHLAAAVETRPGRPKHRPCVVIAGGREPTQWEAYPHHQYLSTTGTLSCCLTGGCWKSRCQLVGDGDLKDRRDVCEQPVQITPDLRIPKCLDMISAEDVIRRIELYYQGGVLSFQDQPQVIDTPQVSVVLPVPPATNGTNGQFDTQIRKGEAPAEPVFSVESARPRPPGVASRNIAKATRNVLITFRHGLGDAVQFTAVLRHLRHYHPDWNVDVQTQLGKHSAFQGLCRKVYVTDRDPPPIGPYGDRYNLDWDECRTADRRWPNTKATRCLLEVFQLTPIPDLCRYEIAVSESARQRARDYLESVCGPPIPLDTNLATSKSLPRYRAVLIHYEGNTSGEQKNLSTKIIRKTCEEILRLNYVPIILDWDRRSPLPDNLRIFCPAIDHPLWNGGKTGDAEQLAALIESSSLMIGIDSGPLHVAGATSTPTIGVWTRHHPIHFFDRAPNVFHLIPPNHEQLVQGPASLDYFRKNYRSRIYRELLVELPAIVEGQLTGATVETLLNKKILRKLNSTGYGEQYYEEHKQAGLDYLDFSEWQRQYGRWLVESLGYSGRRLLDVGCACGSILRGLGEAGAIVQGIDLCEPMIQLGRNKWPDMASLLFVCDAINLHLYDDESWDGLHSAQVAEHWKPALVPFILRELARVTVPGGLFFCALDTAELFARQGRQIESEDPTQVCIQPMSWWHEQLTSNGWDVCTNEWEPALRQHPESFLKRYDWDWWVAKKRINQTDERT